LNLHNKEIRELKLLSKDLGQNNRFIQATGGNTSLKTNKTLIVKASGKDLSRALYEEIFVEIEKKENFITLLLNRPEEAIKFNKISDSSLRESIETPFHLLMPHKWVVHTHCLDIIAWTLQKKSIEKISILLKDYKWSYINYYRPGIPLAISIAKTINKNQSDILILENHGLIIGADSSEKIINLHKTITNLLQLKLREYEPIKNDLLLKKTLEEVKSYFPNASLPKNDIVHTLVTDNISYSLANRNPLYPDHVVFLGKKMIFLDHPSEIKSLSVIPKYIGIKNVGVFLIDSSEAINQMAEAQATIYLMIDNYKGLRCLNDIQCDELLNWEAEKYRISLSKNPK